MHIADGILNISTSAVTGVASTAVLGYSVKKTKEQLDERQVPLLGVTAAFVFAAQMVNFPVLPGTSGHLIGALLIAVLLGPWSAGIVMATVLAIQALFFGDGGVIALGANIFNLAIISTFSGYYVYKLLKKFNQNLAVLIGGWISVITPSFFAALELAVSGILPIAQILPPIVGIHAVIGIGEAIITLVVVKYFQRVRPDLGLDKEVG